VATNRIKIKQITSGGQIYGKHLIADGNSGFTFSDAIEKGTTFPSNPTGGDVYYRTDVDALFHYDDSRSKWFTVKTLLYSCGRNSIIRSTSAYMYAGNAVQSSTNGFIMTYNGTILAATVDNVNVMALPRDVEFRVNNSTTNKVTLTIPASSKSASTITANQDFSSGDTIQVIGISTPVGGTTLSNVIATFEIGWRI